MTLYRYGANLLRGPNGGLAGDANCCCIAIPPCPCTEIMGCCEPFPEYLQLSWTCDDENYSILFKGDNLDCPTSWRWPLPPGTLYCTQPYPDPPLPGWPEFADLPKVRFIQPGGVCSENCLEICRAQITYGNGLWTIEIVQYPTGGASLSISESCAIPESFEYCGIVFTIEAA
jgi:hypothetical protein